MLAPPSARASKLCRADGCRQAMLWSSTATTVCLSPRTKLRNLPKPQVLKHVEHRYDRFDRAIPRYSLFLERYQSKWSGCLPFRGASEFPECDTCHVLKDNIKQTYAPLKHFFLDGPTGRTTVDPSLVALKDLDRRLEFVYAYKQHISDVQKDRALEELLQSEDLRSSCRPILFCQTDGMDQAKWAIPRLGERQGKETASIVRFPS